MLVVLLCRSVTAVLARTTAGTAQPRTCQQIARSSCKMPCSRASQSGPFLSSPSSGLLRGIWWSTTCRHWLLLRQHSKCDLSSALGCDTFTRRHREQQRECEMVQDSYDHVSASHYFIVVCKLPQHQMKGKHVLTCVNAARTHVAANMPYGGDRFNNYLLSEHCKC